MVGNDEDGRVFVGEAQEPAHLVVERLVVVEDGLLVRVPGLVEPVLVVEEAPERVVDAVGAHLDHEEEIPGPRLEQVLGHAKAAHGHLLDLLEEALLLLRAKVVHVDHVAADEIVDLALELRGIRVLAGLRVGREKARDHDAVDAAHRIGLRNAEDDDRPICAVERRSQTRGTFTARESAKAIAS